MPKGTSSTVSIEENSHRSSFDESSCSSIDENSCSSDEEETMVDGDELISSNTTNNTTAGRKFKDLNQRSIDNHSPNISRRSQNPHRYLRVGNLPCITQPEALLDFLNNEMQRAGLCEHGERPVLNCLIHQDAKMGFIGLINFTMSHRALSLDGISYLGTHLKISRPRTRHENMTWNCEAIPTQQHQQHQQHIELQSIIPVANLQATNLPSKA